MSDALPDRISTLLYLVQTDESGFEKQFNRHIHTPFDLYLFLQGYRAMQGSKVSGGHRIKRIAGNWIVRHMQADWPDKYGKAYLRTIIRAYHPNFHEVNPTVALIFASDDGVL